MATTSVGKLHSKPDTAKMLKISIATLDRLIAAGRIEYFKIGWHIRFSDEQIDAFLDSARNAPRERNSAKKTKRARKAA
jgi:excisionase family DNA binding protein